MNRRQHEALELFTRIHAFVGESKPQGDVASLETATASLHRVIESMREYQKEQATLTRLGVEQTALQVEQARRLVLGLARPIARMALVVYPNEPTLAAGLTVPLRGRPEELVAAATSIAEVIAPRLEQFHEAGLAKNVLERLQRAADEVRELSTMRALDRARRIASAEGIREQMQRGLMIVRLLEALVQLPLESNVAQRAEWNALLRRVRRVRSKERLPVSGEPVPASTEAVAVGTVELATTTQEAPPVRVTPPEGDVAATRNAA